MYPKFSQIQKIIKNEFLRVAMYRAKGQERERLEKAFPECYSTDKNDYRTSVSIIRQYLEEKGELDGFASEWTYDLKLPYSDIEIEFCWEVHNYDAAFPEEIIQQLVGKIPRTGIVLHYLGEEFIVTHVCMTPDGQPFHREDLDNKNVRGTIGVVHSRFIDLNS